MENNVAGTGAPPAPSAAATASAAGQSQFPAHENPRVWLFSSGDSPIGISLARQILAHGDYVVCGRCPADSERENPRVTAFENFLEELDNAELGQETSGWKERFDVVNLDIRIMSDCQAAIASTINKYGRIDIVLCCTSQAVIGSVEELATSERARMLLKDQFETNYFGPVNLIKSALPQMRLQRSGHLMVLGGITGHIGTPGLGVYCAAEWALDGYCDSLAYEVAPFNIRITILQSSVEIGVLSNLITSVPPLDAYNPAQNHAPLFRRIMNSVLSQLPGFSGYARSAHFPPSTQASLSSPGSVKQEYTRENDEPLSAPSGVSLYPPLGSEHLEMLMGETMYAVTAIGGHENPPARHIVGAESVACVKEKLKTVSEELEDFIEGSCAVDINSTENPSRVTSDEVVVQSET
ncbi:retinol dehydrogenase [Trichophyton mentagrophytes]|uniref:Short chain dehydrogenase/reductase n=2 Tax=Trichophyton interdigitale TaxID=101480 RepID=A0A9P4YL88_9EURO|nr:hypothetical protein H101_00123 [Trichophyton interdigitale H6]KAF3898935.1 Short chain dehydrogenase/reductase [Trichophyton interdigitale]KDB21904.1 hypothetical protein H109_06169 [Trichophyton interdigitale MR816]GBF62189.1 retinol dehydrogenase [Trichophyton mentagrophytes]KAF3899369.1 Short chain dehydrogenase/reductase [Trichophyton interdigitale]